MILPIVAYGAAVLRKKAKEITAEYPALDKLIADMWETMYASSGVGLAAPQINRDIRVFVMDSAQIFEHMEDDEHGKYPDEPGVKRVFINAHIEETKGDEWVYNEGCLSIPKIREDIYRPQGVTISFVDENFKQHTETFNGISARIILHEYDHIEGKLFIDYMKPLRKKLLQGKLNDISKGKIKVDYKMTFVK
ncbi:MAG: peptide deformylase [Chitinophagaceae bacterium]|nr:peptide deformylase [Chitinophagaceae bacterium]